MTVNHVMRAFDRNKADRQKGFCAICDDSLYGGQPRNPCPHPECPYSGADDMGGSGGTGPRKKLLRGPPGGKP